MTTSFEEAATICSPREYGSGGAFGSMYGLVSFVKLITERGGMTYWSHTFRSWSKRFISFLKPNFSSLNKWRCRSMKEYIRPFCKTRSCFIWFSSIDNTSCLPSWIARSSTLIFEPCKKISRRSAVSILVKSRYVQNLWASVRGTKIVISSLGGTLSSTEAFVLRNMIFETSSLAALRKDILYDPFDMSKESLNRRSEASVKTLGYSQCKSDQSSTRLFWIGVPVKTIHVESIINSNEGWLRFSLKR